MPPPVSLCQGCRRRGSNPRRGASNYRRGETASGVMLQSGTRMVSRAIEGGRCPTSHANANAGHPGPRTEGDREFARALALLEGDDSGSVTLAALRARGVKAPAQAMYDLQLAGHTIDRVATTDQVGHASTRYRLRRPATPAPEPPSQRTRRGRDDGSRDRHSPSSASSNLTLPATARGPPHHAISTRMLGVVRVARRRRRVRHRRSQDRPATDPGGVLDPLAGTPNPQQITRFLDSGRPCATDNDRVRSPDKPTGTKTEVMSPAPP